MEAQQTQQKKDEIKPGIYDFLIKGVQREKDGYALKTKNGGVYQNLVIIALGPYKNYTLFQPVYGRSSLIPIVNSIANPALTHIFEKTKSSNDFELEYLIGESGKVLVGHREYNGNNYPQIECFVKPKTHTGNIGGLPTTLCPPFPPIADGTVGMSYKVSPDSNIPTEAHENSDLLNEDDEVPF